MRAATVRRCISASLCYQWPHFSDAPYSSPQSGRRTEKRSFMPSAPSCAIVIFGASGDLAKRKLIPALYELARLKLLDERSYIVGYSRSPMTDEEFRKEARDAVTKFARTKPVDEAVLKKLEARLFYHAGDYGSQESHAACGERMGQLDRQFGTEPNRLVYISTPPQALEPILTGLGKRQPGQPI